MSNLGELVRLLHLFWRSLRNPVFCRLKLLRLVNDCSMILQYGSNAYIFYLLVSAMILAGIYFIFRKRSLRAKKWLLATLILINVLQHLFKSYLYPHLYGAGFGLQNTAYNVCAALILLSPFTLFGKDSFFKVFVAYAGTIAGTLSLLLPYWFIGQTIFTWEFLRFYVCHMLLLLTSALPLLWGIRKAGYRNFWKSGFALLFLLGIVLLNDVLYFICDKNGSPETLFAALEAQNPFWIMHPTETYPTIAHLFTAITPDFLLPSQTHPYYTPILWYAIPLYLAVTLLSLVLFSIADGKRFLADCRRQRAVKAAEYEEDAQRVDQ